jgi:hypothetical protein
MADIVAHLEAAKWLRATLLADAATLAALGTGGTVYNRRIPTGATGRHIRLQFLSGPGLYAAGQNTGGSSNYRVLTQCRFMVAGVMETQDPSDLEALAKALHEAIDNKQGNTALARIDCSFFDTFEMEEPDGPNQGWLHEGGIYQLDVAPLP